MDLMNAMGTIDEILSSLWLDEFEEAIPCPFEITPEGDIVEYRAFAPEDEEQTGKRTYRTRKGIPQLDAVPDRIALPVYDGFRRSFSFDETNEGFLVTRAFRQVAEYSLKGGYFRRGDIIQDNARILGEEMEAVGNGDIDLQLLAVIYSVFWKKYERSGFERVPEKITVHLSELLNMMGRKENQESQEIILRDIKALEKCLFVYRRNGAMCVYRVLTLNSYDGETKTYSISCPFISEFFLAQIHQKRLTTKKGQLIVKPAHTHLIKSEIAKARDKLAADCVFIIVDVIAAAGVRYTPNISAETIVNRNTRLRDKLETDTNRPKTLKRVFTDTWKYLREFTVLQDYYLNIQLPEPGAPGTVPKYSSLASWTWHFTHNGKNPNYENPQGGGTAEG